MSTVHRHKKGVKVKEPITRLIRVDLLDPPQLAARIEIPDEELQELTESIRDTGLINPICVFANNGRYEVAAGHCRMLAVKRLGWFEVKCSDYTDCPQELEQVKIRENLNRRQMTDGEWVNHLQNLREVYNYDLEKMMKLTGKSEHWIAERMAIYRGDENVHNALIAGQIKISQATEINKFPPEYRYLYLQHVLNHEWPAKIIADYRKQFELMNLPTNLPADTPALVPAESLPGCSAVEPCVLCEEQHSPWAMQYVKVHTGCLQTVVKALKAGGQ